MVLQELDNAVVHDGLCQHFQLEQLSDELDVSERPSTCLVFGIHQLFIQALTLLFLWLKKKVYQKYNFNKHLVHF